MVERIVVRIGTPLREGDARDAFIDRAQQLLRRAKALGASLCAWDWQGFCFAFEPEDFEEAISFVSDSDATRLLKGTRVGVCQGDMVTVVTDGELELGFGDVIRRAAMLAQLADVGEVVLDRNLPALPTVPLMTSGTRTSDEDPRVQGTLLGAGKTWPDQAIRAVDRVAQPALIGRELALRALDVAPGTLATIRAEPGFGGTRLLIAYGERAAPGSTLLISPHGQAMEPLGALRRALGRQLALQQAPRISEPHGIRLRALLAGNGCSPDDAAELLEVWLAGPDGLGNGALLIDDANDVDDATLDVVTASVLGAAHPFRVVARLDGSSALPAMLASLPPGPEVDLAALAPAEAAQLATTWLGGKIGPDAATLWAERAGGIPLALSEALFEGLTSGELRFREDVARARSIAAPPRVAVPAAAWSQRRLRRLAPSSRASLFALAMLGGDAATGLVATVLEAAADVPTDVQGDVKSLLDEGWLTSPQPGWIALSFRTHRRVLLESVPESRHAPWHRACSLAVESREEPLALAEAAWHAAAAGDRSRAQRLALRAADAARRVGLEESAVALNAFARAHDPVPRARIDSDVSGLMPRPPLSWPTGKPEDTFPSALAARGPKRPSRFTFPPVELPAPKRPGSPVPATIPPSVRPIAPEGHAVGGLTGAHQSDVIATAPDHPLPGRRSLPLAQNASPDPLATDLQPPTSNQPPTGAISEPTDGSPIDASGPSDLRIAGLALGDAADLHKGHSAELAELGRRALTSGEPLALEAWLAQLEASGKHQRLIQRVRAIMSLAGHEGSEALGTLRTACEQAQPLGPLERSRSHLAYALGLARVGRANEALVEALEALSRAREAANASGEQACLTFLHELCARTGHGAQADAWGQLARTFNR